MTRRAPTSRLNRRRLIAGLCLVLFQIQLFAASTLGCLHDGNADRPIGCPFHLGMTEADDQAANLVSEAPGGRPTPADSDTNASTSADNNLLDCPRCALHLGLHHLFSHAVEPTAVASRHSEDWPLPRLHFYRFVPDLITKPPIPADA